MARSGSTHVRDVVIFGIVIRSEEIVNLDAFHCVVGK